MDGTIFDAMTSNHVDAGGKLTAEDFRKAMDTIAASPRRPPVAIVSPAVIRRAVAQVLALERDAREAWHDAARTPRWRWIRRRRLYFTVARCYHNAHLLRDTFRGHMP